MKLNTIQQQGQWANIADTLNENFSKVDSAVEALNQATIKNIGYFSTVDALREAYPIASAGAKAYIGATYPFAIYLWDAATSTWVDSGETGGEESVNLGDYYTKEETDAKVAELEVDSITKNLDRVSYDVYGEKWKQDIVTGYYNGEVWKGMSNYQYYVIPIKRGDIVNISSTSARYNILSIYNGFNKDIALSVDSVDDSGNVPTWNATGASKTWTIGEDGHYLMVYALFSGNDTKIKSITINGVDVWEDKGLIVEVEKIKDETQSLYEIINGEEWRQMLTNGYYNGEVWKGMSNYQYYVIPIKNGDIVNISSTSARYNILSIYNGFNKDIALSVDSVDDSGNVPTWNATGASKTWTIGEDGHYLMVYALFSGNDTKIKSITINGVDVWEDKSLLARVSKNEDAINRLEGSISITDLNGGHDYLDLIFQNLTRAQGYENGTKGNSPYVLLYFSDIHGENTGEVAADSISRIVDFKNEFSSYISDVLHGGDGSYTRMGDDNTLDYAGAESFLDTIGNHDVLIDGGGFADEQVSYNEVMANKIADWGVVYTEGKCYYYKDNAESKLRLIVLDCLHWSEEQNIWLANTLATANSIDYAVMICTHYVPSSKFVEVDCAFTTLGPFSVTSGGVLNAQAAATVNTEIENGLSFVAWLFGHTHNDYFGYIENYPKQYAIGIAKASGGYSGWEQDSVRPYGTKAYDCLDVISVDTTRKIFSITRIGNNTDRFMRKKNFLTFDYDNHKLLSVL